MSDIEFIGGLIVKPPHENAPEYVIAKLSIKREEMIEWLQGRSEEWINAEVKEAKSGKFYAAVDDWKPDGKGKPSGEQRGNSSSGRSKPAPSPQSDGFEDMDIPFATNRGTF